MVDSKDKKIGTEESPQEACVFVVDAAGKPEVLCPSERSQELAFRSMRDFPDVAVKVVPRLEASEPKVESGNPLVGNPGLVGEPELESDEDLLEESDDEEELDEGLEEGDDDLQMGAVDDWETDDFEDDDE